MSIDNDKFIASQAVVKSLLESMPNLPEATFDQIMKRRFNFCIKLMEEYATINPDDEWINTGVRVPKAYWDTRNEELIMEGNRPQKTEKGWFIFSQKKHIHEFKEFIDKQESDTKSSKEKSL